MTIPANPLECLVNLAQSVRLRFFWSTEGTVAGGRTRVEPEQVSTTFRKKSRAAG